MQSQIYRILSARSGKPLRQIIRDTKRMDFYLDAPKALEYGLVDQVLGVTHASTPVLSDGNREPNSEAAAAVEAPATPDEVEENSQQSARFNEEGTTS
jgi:hypothetical protein